MLMNLRTGRWDADLLRLFDIPSAMLPSIRPSSGMLGTIEASHLGTEIPITGVAGDQQAALAGQACFRPGLSKNTYGTGCFALLHTGERMPVSKCKLLATRAASPDSSATFAIEGSVFIAGAAVQWLRDKLGLISTAAESETLAESAPDNAGVYLVPAFVGLGAPHWDSAARGLLTGITAATGRAHIVRAALESIAYQTRGLMRHPMEADSGEQLKKLARGRRSLGQQLPDAVPGRYPWPPDRAPGRYRDDRVGRRLPCRIGLRLLEKRGGDRELLARRARSSSRAWLPVSARRLFGKWQSAVARYR